MCYIEFTNFTSPACHSHMLVTEVFCECYPRERLNISKRRQFIDATPQHVRVFEKHFDRHIQCKYAKKTQAFLESCQGITGSPCDDGKLLRFTLWQWDADGKAVGKRGVSVLGFMGSVWDLAFPPECKEREA